MVAKIPPPEQMVIRVSKSRFKPRALEYFRQVEQTGRPVIITDRGTPVLQISLVSERRQDALLALRGTVVQYHDPTEPVGVEDWEALG